MKKITLIICVFAFSANTLIAQLNFDNYLINPYSLISTSSGRSNMVLYDFDNDGDEDILAYSEFGVPQLYNNIGTATIPKFDSPVTSPYGLTKPQNVLPYTPTLGDIDGDGDIDLLVGDQSGNFYLYKNTGTTGSPNFSSPALLNEYNLSAVSTYSSPAFGDLDNDGDLDIISGDLLGNLVYFVNTGTSPQTPNYTNRVNNPFSIVPPTNQGGHSSPVLIDLDSDGDLDLFCGYRYDFVYFQNTGSATAPSFAPPVIGPVERRTGDVFLTAAFADLDGDGDKELISGNFNRRFHVYENLNLPATFTWNGATSTDWNVSSNWTSNAVPGAINRVVIPEIGGRSAKYPVITTNISTDRVEINENARIDISTTGHLTVSTLVLEDTLYVSSEGAVQVTDIVRGSSLAQIVRVTTHNSGSGRYSIMGSPVRDQSSEALGSVVYSYDEQTAYGTDGSSRFQQITSPLTMTMGKGYFSAFTGTVIYHGIPEFGNVDVSLIYDAIRDGGSTNAGFNLVSNPYPAPMTYSALVSANPDIDGTIYLWDDGGSDISQRTNNDYVTVTGAGATGGSGRATDWDGNIRSAQGFFVKAIAAGTLNFTPTMMVTGSNTDAGYFRTTNTDDQYEIRLKLSSDQSSSEILIALRDDATLGIDRTLDGVKMMGAAPVQLYSLIGDEPMAIQALPNLTQETTVDLGFDASEAGHYTFDFSELLVDDFTVYLIDNQRDHTENITLSKSYSFETGSVTNSDRFSLLITPNNVLSTAPDISKDELIIYSNAGELTVRMTKDIEKANVKIFNLSGQLLQHHEELLFQNGTVIVAFNKTGLYILTIETESGSFSRKFIK